MNERLDTLAAPIHAFYTPVFTRRVFSEPVAHLLADTLEKLRDRPEMEGHKRSVVSGFHTRDLLDVTEFARARFAISEVMDRITAEHYGFPMPKQRLVGLWGNVLGPGHYHAPHVHTPHAWSGVLYLRAAHVVVSASARPGQLEIFPTDPTCVTGKGMLIRPIDGCMVVFPATTLHMVHPAPDARSPRVSMAFNLVPVVVPVVPAAPVAKEQP